jgi:predicted regulator of amino acid metabolism with ACT domain
MEELFKIVIDRTQIDPRKTPYKTIEVVDTRSALSNVFRRCYRIHLTDIAKLLNIHHTTVIHHINNHDGRYICREEYRALYDELVDYASFGYVVDDEIFDKIKDLCI